MGLCCCFPSLNQNATTTRENQTFLTTQQDAVCMPSNSMQLSADACSLSPGATNPYPAPTEHRLSWSHAPHPPSVASSTLFDPEGQAFAKHYNPLLSGETSHGSQYSSDKNAVAMRRFGEAAQLNSHSSSPAQDSSTAGVHCTATSRYTAPPNQAMHAAHDPTTSPAAAAQMETYQNVDRPTDAGQDQADWGPGNPHVVRGQGVAAQGRDGQGGAGGCEKGLQGVLGQSSKQSSLGRQLGDALKLRKWKPNRQPDLTPLADSTSPRPGPSLSPRTESAMMLAASELGFDAKQGGNVGQSAKPTLPGSPSEAVQLVTLPQLAPEGPMLAHPSLSAASVTMLQSMAARAASFKAGGTHDATAPPSPVPSIDRFSSMSSWGASSHSPDSCHGSCSSPLGRFMAGKDKTALPQQLNNLAQARHHAGRRTQEEEEAHSKAQHSSTGGSAMRAMHDSSSSWTDRSLPATTSAAAKQQADVACLPTPHAQVEHVQPVPLKPVPEGAMDMQGADSEAACVGQAASVVPAPGPVATAPLNDGDAARKAATPLQSRQPVAGAGAGAVTVKAPDGTAVSSKPQQTLEEMAAWLDAQLATAPGRRPIISPIQAAVVARKGNSPAPTAVGVVLPLAVADGRQSLSRQLPMGQLGQSPSQAATAASSIGSRSSSSSNQARSRPTGLPLARKASHAEPMGKSVGNSVGKPVCKPVGRQAASQKGKGSDMSVTEMMQWLDRKLGQASAGRPMQTDQTGGLNQGVAAAASAASTDKLNPQNLSEPSSMTGTTACAPATLEHDQNRLHTAGADGMPSQQAASGNGQETSCSVEQQSAVPRVQLPQADEQASSSATLGPATAMPTKHVSSSALIQHAQHPAAGEQSSSAQASLAVSAGTSTSCMAAAASAADDITAGSGVSAAVGSASKQPLTSTAAAAAAAAATTAGASPGRPGAGGKSGGGVERQQSVPALRPAQTAAEMLSWLDTALSAKKPLSGKAAGNAAAKVFTTVPAHSIKAKPKQLSTQVGPAAMQGSGTTDMLAWLDAKIAAQRAALIN